MSKYTVYLSPVAEFKLDKLLEHLAIEWGDNSKAKFLKGLQSSVSKIESFPESCTKTNEMGGFYKCIVSKQTSFYYRIDGFDIEILTITDNRQDPNSVLEEIKKFR